MRRAPLKIAVIGAGRWAKNIISTLQTLPECQVTHIVARSRRNLEQYRSSGAALLTDSTPLLTEGVIDAAIIVTPATTHALVAIPFIARGIPVLIEKPLAGSLADAKRIVTAAKKHHSYVAVGHIHLHNPAFKQMQKMLRSLGDVRDITGIGTNNGPIRDDVSALWDWAPHDLSMLLTLIKEKPRSVRAWGNLTLRTQTKLYDTTDLQLTFPNNMVCRIHSSWLSPQKVRTFTVMGTRSTLIYDDTKNEKLTLFTSLGPRVEGHGKNARVTPLTPTVTHPSHPIESPLKVEMESFIRHIRTHSSSTDELMLGLEVVRILDAAERSIQKGVAVRL